MQRQRGVSLIEVMISMLLVVVALLGMMASLSSATQGSSMSSRLSQAQARAQSIIDAIRTADPLTLGCLARANTPAGWAACEQSDPNSCVAMGGSDGGVPNPAACIYTTTSPGGMTRLPAPPSGQSLTTNLSVDRSGQPYSVVFDAANPTGPNSSFVQTSGPGGRVFDIQVTIGWNDDGTASATPPGTAGGARHTVTLRTGVFN